MEQNSTLRSLALIPCYNEQQTVASLVQKTKPYVDTVLVVDDGSSDNTPRVAQQAGAVVLSHVQNKGKGAAIKTGFAYALEQGFDDVVTMDGDGQHDPDEIPVILSELRSNGHDLVIGTRFGSSTEMPVWRKLGKRVLDYATGFGTGGFVTDSQSGFRGFNKKAVQTLVPLLTGDAFSVESEELIKAHEKGLQMGSTRVSCKYHGLETSTKKPTSHGLSVLRCIIKILLEKHPLLFIGVPALMCLLLGLATGLYTMKYYYTFQVVLIPFAVLVGTFVLMGVLGMVVAVVLQKAPRVFQRGKREPL